MGEEAGEAASPAASLRCRLRHDPRRRRSLYPVAWHRASRTGWGAGKKPAEWSYAIFHIPTREAHSAGSKASLSGGRVSARRFRGGRKPAGAQWPVPSQRVGHPPPADGEDSSWAGGEGKKILPTSPRLSLAGADSRRCQSSPHRHRIDPPAPLKSSGAATPRRARTMTCRKTLLLN
jgi:hypothetical protein